MNESDVTFYPIFQFNNETLIETNEPWWSGSGYRPPKENFCELDGSDCPPEPIHPIVIAGPTIAVLVAIALVIGISSRVYYVKITKKAIIERNERHDLIGNFNEIVNLDPEPKALHEVSTQSSMPRTLSIYSSYSFSDKKPTLTFEKGTVVRGRFRGKPCLVAMLAVKCAQVTYELIQNLKMVKQLRHVNFMAICLADEGHLCIMQELCTKGTLTEILQRKRVQLDKVFKLSFAVDIAAGMAYIHDSPLKSHGHLNSSAILIDSRWNCRIGDLTLPLFKENNVTDLWMAPELLRCDRRPLRGTQPGDVYAFGIILYEIITRELPYQSYYMSEEG